MALKRIIGASVAAMLVTTPVMAASGEAIRSANTSVSTATPSGANAGVRSGTRVGSQVGEKNSLLGAPLFLAFLGAVVITIGTIIIINNNGNSPGG